MVLAMMSLALPGHREHVDNGDCNGGNFLALVAMQAWFDRSRFFFRGTHNVRDELQLSHFVG